MLTRAFLIILFSTSVVFTQEDSDSVVLPDAVMRQVISRIVRWNFKSTHTKKTVPISERNIKREWLPTIGNVDFEFVSDEQTLDYADGVFLVQPVTDTGRSYSISVGWGDRTCSAAFERWKFIVESNRVRLWPTGEGWGNGCGGTGQPIVRGLKIGDISPNELPDHRFFAQGKLRTILLGISTREDMIKVFGETCEGACDYDEQWRIWVNYFSDEAESFETTTGEEVTKWERVASPELIGKLRWVSLIPKRRIPFQKVIFADMFRKNSLYSIGCAWGVNGFEGSVHTSTDTYTDGYGLSYEIYDKETFNNLRNPDADEKKRLKGDLVGIEYEIPAVLEHKVYIKRVRPVEKK